MNFEIHAFVCLAGGGGIAFTAHWIFLQEIKQQSVIIIVLRRRKMYAYCSRQKTLRGPSPL
jgi:hypothetical protein